MYTDRAIVCRDCGQEFTFTAGEQEFYEQRGFTEAPKRCATCRAERKAQRQQPAYGSNGPAAGYGSAYGGYGGAYADAGYAGGNTLGGGGYRERREREMFEVVCADCGKPARVPFRPSGARPVYCSECFQGRR